MPGPAPAKKTKCENPHCNNMLELGEGITLVFLYPAAEGIPGPNGPERVLAPVQFHFCPSCYQNAVHFVYKQTWADIAAAIAEYDNKHPERPRPWSPPWGWDGEAPVG